MNIKSVSDRVVERGRESRGEYDPAPDSWMTRTYLRYYRGDWVIGDRPEQENFCHFWRVVLIWSWLTPILWALAGFLEKNFSTLDTYFKERPDTLIRRAVRAVKRGGKSLASNRYFRYVVVGIILATPVYLLGVVVYVLFSEYGPANALMGLLAAVGTFAVILGLIFGLSFISDLYNERQQEAMRVRLEAYYAGKISFDEAFPVKKRKAPGKVRQFLSKAWNGVLDTIILVTQIVRVHKWKICPFVNVPGTEKRA